MVDEKTVTITVKEYQSLKESEWELTCLENAGVDNWSGYEYAQELMEDED